MCFDIPHQALTKTIGHPFFALRRNLPLIREKSEFLSMTLNIFELELFNASAHTWGKILTTIKSSAINWKLRVIAQINVGNWNLWKRYNLNNMSTRTAKLNMTHLFISYIYIWFFRFSGMTQHKGVLDFIKVGIDYLINQFLKLVVTTQLFVIQNRISINCYVESLINPSTFKATHFHRDWYGNGCKHQ